MAWGDIRFDHSDIFGEPRSGGVPPKSRPRTWTPKATELRKRVLDMIGVGQAHISTVAAGLGKTNNAASVLLKRMVSDGFLVSERTVSRGAGPAPLVYRVARTLRLG